MQTGIHFTQWCWDWMTVSWRKPEQCLLTFESFTWHSIRTVDFTYNSKIQSRVTLPKCSFSVSCFLCIPEVEISGKLPVFHQANFKIGSESGSWQGLLPQAEESVVQPHHPAGEVTCVGSHTEAGATLRRECSCFLTPGQHLSPAIGQSWHFSNSQWSSSFSKWCHRRTAECGQEVLLGSPFSLPWVTKPASLYPSLHLCKMGNTQSRGLVRLKQGNRWGSARRSCGC